MAEVAAIVRSLGGLEDDLDRLEEDAAKMGRQLAAGAQTEAESLMEAVRKEAGAEAARIVEAAKKEAEAGSRDAQAAGEARVQEMRSKIDANFDKAVERVVSTVLEG
ncbi:MAG: hypothetical protein MPI95_06950 [Nitrosopumilus sp.]|nr:hypothetical protein [Nitrosopumilus sp.]CAI9830937.1 conserved hypothetical protein [Nitrosopumilaceae archaeon]MDA7942211.1 hypothetical protein [Nitrosopumilus sp.]MDA7944108.1 hypothetical protein [Nitrosopumilus sp.]MDA7945649.1 hypothetical protein [Nitrosopumilus sp.]